VTHIAKKLDKGFHDVNDNDIRNHGLLVIIKDGDQATTHRPEDDENYYGQHPHTVEPGDYYGEHLPADGFLTGAALMRFLRQHGEHPRSWGDRSPHTEKIIKGDLIRLAIQQHPERNKEDIIKKVQSLTVDKAQKMLNQYRQQS